MNTKEFVQNILKEIGHNQAAAAKALDMSPQQFSAQLGRESLRVRDFMNMLQAFGYTIQIVPMSEDSTALDESRMSRLSESGNGETLLVNKDGYYVLKDCSGLRYVSDTFAAEFVEKHGVTEE